MESSGRPDRHHHELGRDDRWFEWVSRRRDAGLRGGALAYLDAIRDAVLAGAALGIGDRLVDVGCGDGLIGIAACDRVGPEGEVVFVDISPAVLALCKRKAELCPRCRTRFLATEATELAGVWDGEADAVAARSVLIYVADKRAAFRAFHRVLVPGGRVSIWEPIKSRIHPEEDGRFLGYDVSAVWPLASRVREVYEEMRPRPDASMDFDEGDLETAAEEAGFAGVEVTLKEFERTPKPVDGWDAFLDNSPNPMAPTIREAVEMSLDRVEARTLFRNLRPAAEAGSGVVRYAVAELRARKQADP